VILSKISVLGRRIPDSHQGILKLHPLNNKLNRYLLLIAFLLLSKYSYCQLADTNILREVYVNSYFSVRPYLRTPSSLAIIDTATLAKQQGGSLVSALNTLPGVRMEERSPGSYRLSIRGSLLRSPFGVRNVKIYLDEFPLTDAGGNTYLNLLDVNVIDRMEVLKGPDGSLFGANSGGVVRISPTDTHIGNTYFKTGFMAGSNGLIQQNTVLQLSDKKNNLSVSEALQKYNGYRDNSSLKRQYYQLTDKLNYSSHGQLRVMFFYSDLNYLTPGGLTLSQSHDNPRAARPPTALLPGAAEQNAGVHNKTFWGGILNEIKINNHWRHVIAVFGSHTDFENRFITNFEVRKETSLGVRTWLEAANHSEGSVNLTFDIGGEAQKSPTRIGNYGNRYGIKDTVQAVDYLKVIQRFGFARFSADFYNRFTFEASASINDNRFLFTGIQPVQTREQKRVFTPQIMPRIVLSYLISENLALRASVSRGYSPPTSDEIRPSNDIVNTSLQAESGWNYETGYRLHDKHDRIWWDLSVYYYQLQQAIVRRTDDAGNEFFINAGGIRQPGLESLLTLNLIPAGSHNFVRHFQLTNSITYNRFKFDNYKDGTNDYSGNYLTGVPQYVIVTGLTLKFPLGFFAFAQYNYTGRIPLNDSNSIYSDPYNLIFFKGGWESAGHHNLTYKIYAGIDNLLNEQYSLGNDLNATGGRYYNPSPARNYFAGLNVTFGR
jgi:iron complex outermembrane receptor protein